MVRLFVEDSAAIPDLVGLDQFTNYSVQMALVDSSNQTCLFGDPVFAMTGECVCVCMWVCVCKANMKEMKVGGKETLYLHQQMLITELHS